MNASTPLSTLLRQALLLLLLVGCRTTPPPAPSAPDPMVEGLKQLVQAQPGNGAALYTLASVQASRGENAEALQRLEQLAGLSWGFAPDDGDFGALASTPEYRAIAQRLAAQEPQVARSRPAFTLTERDLIPEGIAHDPATDTLFVGSISKRKVLAVAKDGTVRDFIPEARDGLWSVLGLKVDAARRHLWVASFASKSMKGVKPEEVGRAGLFQYELPSGALLARYTLDNTPRHHLLNDIAVSAEGDVFVTDSEAGAVHVLRAGTKALTPLVPEGSLIYPNGIALSAKGAHLYVASFGGIAVVNPVSGEHTPLQAAPGIVLAGIDGLSLHQGSLIAVQNGLGRARVTRFHFGTEPTRVERAEVLESGNRLFSELPTTGTVVGNAFLYIANSQLRRLGPTGELPPPGQLSQTVLLRMELSGE
ncbi:MAG TPA: gluconolaconase [Myxococcaceae bacterium]|jgi:sugar lactone lactonase YvrE